MILRSTVSSIPYRTIEVYQKPLTIARVPHSARAAPCPSAPQLSVHDRLSHLSGRQPLCRGGRKDWWGSLTVGRYEACFEARLNRNHCSPLVICSREWTICLCRGYKSFCAVGVCSRALVLGVPRDSGRQIGSPVSGVLFLHCQTAV